MDEIQLLKKKIGELEKKIDDLKKGSTLPYEVERALQTRGFLKNDDAFLAGSATITLGGTFSVDVPVSTKSIAIATYATAGTDIGTLSAVIRPSTSSPNGNEIYIEGVGGAPIYYLIFKSVDKAQYTQ